MGEPATNSRSNRAQVVFLAVVECGDLGGRTTILERECTGDPELRKRVEELLRGHDQIGQFLGPVPDAPEDKSVTTDAAPASGSPPKKKNGEVEIGGRYKLLQRIGEGGMGVVWLADQREPIKRKVAVKLIKSGMDTKDVLARFEAERHALALMDHPGIARVLDGGTTEEGRPYFVMELVKGLPLTEYCDEREMPIEQRLELFCEVCAAVQHAHQKGIIHRDLKPSNVLVAEQDGRPAPKVIDFGLAKVLGDNWLASGTFQTAIGAILGTPLYMAPEQIGVNLLDVDTRADIYALGVILYELLTGTTPVDSAQLQSASWDEIRRVIREIDPPRPSTRLSSSVSLPSIAEHRRIGPSKLSRLVRGDLDWIVMKALEKDRNRRYPTANDFAEDVRRFLAREAIEAGPPSQFYRLKRFAQRNRGGVIAAGLIVLALVAGLIGTTWGLIRAESARRDEVQQRHDADEARLRESERADGEARATKLATAKQKEAELARTMAQNEFLRAKAIYTFLLKDILEFDDPSDPARESLHTNDELKYQDVLRRAAKSLDGRFQDQPIIEAQLRLTLANGFNPLGLSKEALPQLERSLVLFTTARGANHEDTLYVMSNLVQTLTAIGHLKRAIALGEQCVDRHTARFGSAHPDTLIARMRLGLGYLREDVPRGVRELDECARQFPKAFGPDDPRAFVVATTISEGYLRVGRGKQAIPILSDAYTKLTARYGPDNPNTLSAQSLLGKAELIEDNRTRAVSLLEDCVTRLSKTRGATNSRTLEAQITLANAYSAIGSPSKALSVLEDVLPKYRGRYGYNPATLALTRDVIWAYSDTNQHQKAIEMGEAESQRIRGWNPMPEPELAGVLTSLGRALLKADKTDEAEAVMREVIAIRNRIQPNTWFEATAQAILGQVLVDRGNYKEAEPLLVAGFIGVGERPNGWGYSYIRQARQIDACNSLIELYEKTQRPNDATAWRAKLKGLTAGSVKK